MIRKPCLLGAALILLGFTVAVPAGAQERHDRHHEREDRGDRDWHDHDIARFHDHDFDRWRGGQWWHGRHGGRAGWWWIVNGTWYWYPAPAYPYPNPYQPPAVAPPPPNAYYWCGNPQGYYPYVPQCATPWRVVPAR